MLYCPLIKAEVIEMALHNSQRWSIFPKTKMFVVPLPLTLTLCLSQNKEFLQVTKVLMANYTTIYIYTRWAMG
jgi:hypothetical protein